MMIKRYMLFYLVFLLGACATLQPDFEKPSVELMAIRALPSEGITPQFEIDLKVLNPNRTELKLSGASYSISLDNFELIKGVASNLPVVPAYGDAKFTLRAGMSLMQGIRFVSAMASDPRESIAYEVKAKLDMGPLSPAIRVTEAGDFSVDNLRSAAGK